MAGPHAQAGGYAVRGAVGAVVVADAAREKEEREQAGAGSVSNCNTLALFCHKFKLFNINVD